MTSVSLALPAQVAGEDVENPPFAPVPAVVAARWPESSAEFGGAMKHDGWPSARAEWTDLTPEERAEHRDLCAPSTGGPCALCEAHREFGGCTGCGRTDAEIIAGQTTCCAAATVSSDEFERWWDA